MAKRKVEKEIEEVVESDDKELVEAEESQGNDSGEPDISAEDLKIPESDFEVSDFSIGDMGLATANAETSWKGNLETTLADEPQGKWEEKQEEREENNFYQGGVNEREAKDTYSEVEHGSDFYTGGGKGTDLYSSDSGNYNAKNESGEFYDPRVGKRTDVEEVRQVGNSKLEVTGLQGGFGRGTEKDIRDKRDDKKYSN